MIGLPASRNDGKIRVGRIFGISPRGNVVRVFHTQYADVYLWCGVDGYID